MRRLIEFIRSTYVVVLFVLLELTAISYYARASVYTEARLLARSNSLFGGLHALVTDVENFFGLGRENRALTSRIAALEEELARYREADRHAALRVELRTMGDMKYRMMEAAVVSNTTGRARNYITLNRGGADGVTNGMGVITPDGMIAGYVVDYTEHYAIAVSILNPIFRGSGTPEGTNYQGAIRWDGGNPHFVTLEGLSKYADPKVGQKIFTTGFESYFPEGLLIGTIESFVLDAVGTTYTVRVRLAADLSAMNNLIIIENSDLSEISDLQQSEVIKYLEDN
ncbi:MAG: rod shape-determining protein MreC [Rikenellaceae bacterium]|nr:rod shape-determining protein MreC [Rikenellaceae bacterium]